MEAYQRSLRDLNALNYQNHVSRNLTSKNELIKIMSAIKKRRLVCGSNTAIISINRDKIIKRSRMKTLRAPDSMLLEHMEDLISNMEKNIDLAMKNACSRCGSTFSKGSEMTNNTSTATTTNSNTTTTHGADLPVNLPATFKRWVPIPYGSASANKNKRLVIEQTGRYDGSKFVPKLPGKSLCWNSNKSRLESRMCCLLDYMLKRGIKEWSSSNSSVSSMLVENISLKLLVGTEKDNEIVPHIEQEDIHIYLLL